MSLTIFLHNKTPEVEIITWFLDQQRTLAYAKAPIVMMASSEFRERGYNWICEHFRTYKTRRLWPQDIRNLPQLFTTKTVKQVMDDSDVVEIKSDNAEWTLIPRVVRRNTFPNGTEPLEQDKRRTIPEFCGPELFWKTFDTVFEFTHWHST